MMTERHSDILVRTPRLRAALDRLWSGPAVSWAVVWYIMILVPTLVLKDFYIRCLHGVGPFAAINGGSASGAQRATWGLLLFSGDVRELFLLVVVLWVLVSRLSRRQADVLLAASIALVMLAGIANYLSLQIIGSLLTRENLVLARDWIRDHPDALGPSRGPVWVAAVVLLLLAGVTLWTAMSLLLRRDLVRTPRREQVARWALLGIIALQPVAIIARRAGGGSLSHAHLARAGFWADAALAWIGPEAWHPYAIHVPPALSINARYGRLVYPRGADSNGYLVDIPSARLVPRHVIIISLETAPRRYYPISDNADLPAFLRMSQRAIVSNHHYATEPATTWAIYSILSGTYPRPGGTLLTHGDFRTDGLATILGQRGYETTFIDSYKIDWMSGVYRDHNSRLISDLGFTRLLDASADSTVPLGTTSYELLRQRERRSFARALAAVADAQRRGRKALVFVATVLGHYPWPAAPADHDRPAPEKLYALTKILDGLASDLLRGLDSLRLTDQVLIVVTGDHGFRSQQEFSSVHEGMQFGDLSFNVPFLLYAPGLLDHEVRLPYVTSHVDITPTILRLCGARDSAWVHEGEYILDRRLSDRTTFLMNNTLRPVDGFYRDGQVFAVNRITGELRVSRADANNQSAVPGADPMVAPMRPAQAESLLQTATQLFDTTAAYFLQRGAPISDR